MRPVLLFLLLLVAAPRLTAQDVRVSRGIKLTNKASDFFVLGKTSAGFVVQRSGKRTYLDLHGTDLRTIRTTEVKLPKRAELRYVLVDYDGGHVIHLESADRATVVKVRQMDARLRIRDEARVLDTITDPLQSVMANLRYTASMNRTMHMFFTPEFGPGGLQHFTASVYDDGLVHQRTWRISAEQIDDRRFLYAEVTNDGDAVLIFGRNTTRSGGDDKWDDLLGFSLRQRGGQRPFAIVSRLPLFNRPRFEIDNVNDRLIMAGLFETPDGGRRPGAGSVGTIVHDLETGEFVHKGSWDLTAGLMRDLTGSEPDGAVQLFTFRIADIVPRMDGGALVVAESFYTETRNEFMPSVFMGPTMNDYRSRTVYHFNDLLLFEMEPSGRLDYARMVRKRQESEEDRGLYSSFFLHNHLDALEMAFSEDISSDATFTGVEVDTLHAIDRRALFNLTTYDVRPIPRMAHQTAVNEWIMPALDGRDLHLVKLLY